MRETLLVVQGPGIETHIHGSPLDFAIRFEFGGFACWRYIYPRFFVANRAIPFCNSPPLSLGSRDDSDLYCRRVSL
jgi:hypothetical protein